MTYSLIEHDIKEIPNLTYWEPFAKILANRICAAPLNKDRTPSPQEPHAASPPSPQEPHAASPAATGAGVLTQGQLDALAAVNLDADTLLHIEDEDLNELFTALSVSVPNKLKIKAARKKLQSSVLASASTSSPPAAALPATTPAAPSSFSSASPAASPARSPGPRAPPPSSPPASSPSTSLARPRALFPSSPPASSSSPSPSSSSSPSSAVPSSAACGAFTPAGPSNAAVWGGSKCKNCQQPKRFHQ
eukprot:g49379.t1